MTDKQILRAACRHVDADQKDVLSYRIYEDYIALVVDCGIHGCPKLTVPLAELQPEEPKPTRSRRRRTQAVEEEGPEPEPPAEEE